MRTRGAGLLSRAQRRSQPAKSIEWPIRTSVMLAQSCGPPSHSENQISATSRIASSASNDPGPPARNLKRHPAPWHSVVSHGLPNRDFWEDLASGSASTLLILLVGAAGFEPTTCSTQNCRATRLRYTPNALRRRSHRTLGLVEHDPLGQPLRTLRQRDPPGPDHALAEMSIHAQGTDGKALARARNAFQGLAALHPACCNRSYGCRGGQCEDSADEPVSG
jgi:hypothetical protein